MKIQILYLANIFKKFIILFLIIINYYIYGRPYDL